jgi:hypothetical protein
MVCLQNSMASIILNARDLCPAGISGDHIFGLLPLLASRLNGAGGMIDGTLDPRTSGVLDSEVSTITLASR